MEIEKKHFIWGFLVLFEWSTLKLKHTFLQLFGTIILRLGGMAVSMVDVFEQHVQQLLIISNKHIT